jgi:hypothetical protein
MTSHQKHRQERAPIGTVAVGLLLVIPALLLLLLGYSEVPKRTFLQAIAGQITTAEMRCGRGGCQALIQIEDTDGIWHLAYNDDAATERRLVRRLNTGDSVTALAPLPDREHFQWLWELRRGGEMLLSYEQTASVAASNRSRGRVLGYAAALLSALAIMRGVVHWIRYKSWQA